MSICFDETFPAMDRLVSLVKPEGIQYRIVVSSSDQSNENITSVKTLIWEAIPNDKEQSVQEPHYFVTVLEASQRVDKQVLKREMGCADDLDLELVETATAERLTGFVTGTIPPFGHAIPMMSLYMDTGLITLNVDGMASVGSGAVGYDLLLTKTDMLRLCEKTARVKVCPIAEQSNSGAKKALNKDTVEVKSSQSRNKKMNSKMAGGQLPSNLLRKPKKPLAKRLRDAAGKAGKAEVVRELIQEAGVTFPKLMDLGADGNFTKNALHLAAWKGDLDSIRLLAQAGSSFDLDLVNVISTGEGNYGKTPIFYSMTQCRDDAVKLLVDLGANLLIVNNKGQTPCSMAPSHLKNSTCEFLYDMEAKQLREGGTFVDYRTSHSDGKRYGDLDPRFPIDDDNMDTDIAEELDAYRQALGLVNGDKPLKLPTGSGFPRSVRQTTREIRQARALKNRGKSNLPMDQSTYIHTVREPMDGSEGTQEPKRRSRRQRKRSPPPAEVIDVTNLECLRLHDVLQGEPILVHDDAGMRHLQKSINVTVNADLSDTKTSTSSKGYYPSDTFIAQSCWGLDCEWKPAREKGHDNPVATLQLSSPDQAFLVDLQQLCQPHVKTADCEMTEMEKNLSESLTRLFADKNTTISGFGIGQDLSKLATSFPHLPCFRLFESVIDLQLISRNAFPAARKDYVNSLQKAVAILMNRRLDKAEQCSDWQQRPLSSSQIEYAMLDAVLSRSLVAMVFDKIAEVDSWENEFFKKHSHLRQTVRMQLLEPPQEEEEETTGMAYQVSMGTVKRMLSIRIAKQTWPTGKQAPPLPKCIPLNEAEPQRNNKRRTDKLDDETASSTPRSSRRGRGVSLNTLPADQEGLPPAGVYIGWTKDSCVNRILGKQVLNSMPRDFKLRYNRWGGVIEMSNSWLLFINFKGQGNDWKYRDEFSSDGRQITFSINPHRPQEHDLLEFVENQAEENDDTKLFLFARPNSREKFLFCGECKCVERSTVEHDVNLQLELLDYDTLVGTEGGPYEQLVMKHHDDSQ